MQGNSYISETGMYHGFVKTGRPAKNARPELGERIAKARKEAGLTQIQLAERLGVTQRVVTYWEREATTIKADQLAQLAAALAVTSDDLLGRTIKKKRGPGPSGKARRLFEEVSKLPRAQQTGILQTVQDMLDARKAKNGS